MTSNKLAMTMTMTMTMKMTMMMTVMTRKMAMENGTFCVRGCFDRESLSSGPVNTLVKALQRPVNALVNAFQLSSESAYWDDQRQWPMFGRVTEHISTPVISLYIVERSSRLLRAHSG